MTISELYHRLKEKGYENAACEVTIDLSNRRLLPDEAPTAEYAEAVQSHLWHDLELDRRAVFLAWYGEEEGFLKLTKAQLSYATGQLDSCIDYILANP